MRPGERDASLPAQFAGEIAFAFEAQPLAGRAEDGDAQAKEFRRPRPQRPLERHRDQQVGPVLPETGAGVGYFDAGNAGTFLTRPIMGVVAGEVGRDLRAVAPQVTHQRLSEGPHSQQRYPLECRFTCFHAIESTPQRFGSESELKSRKMPGVTLFILR